MGRPHKDALDFSDGAVRQRIIENRAVLKIPVRVFGKEAPRQTSKQGGASAWLSTSSQLRQRSSTQDGFIERTMWSPQERTQIPPLQTKSMTLKWTMFLVARSSFL